MKRPIKKQRKRLPVGYIWECRSLYEMDERCNYFLSLGYDVKPTGDKFNLVICGDDTIKRRIKRG